MQKFYSLGVASKENGNIPGYIEALSIILDFNPDSTSILHERGDAYLKLKNFAKAVEDFALIAELNPCAATFLNLGNAQYCVRYDNEQVLKSLTKALEFPDCKDQIRLEVLMRRGLIFSVREMHQEAIQDLEAVRQGCQSNKMKYHWPKGFSYCIFFSMLAKNYFETGQFDKTLECLNECLGNIDPRDPMDKITQHDALYDRTVVSLKLAENQKLLMI